MDSIEVELMASQAMNERMAQTIGEQDAEIARLRAALAEAQRELQEIRGVIGFPGAVALAEAGLTESLADVVRYTHRQWLEQTHNSNQRVIRAEAAVDAAQRERDAEKAENEELRADLVFSVRESLGCGNRYVCSPLPDRGHREIAIRYDGTDADLCRAIRGARVS